MQLFFIGAQHLDQGSIFEKHRDMYCCGASLDAGSSSVRLADLCLCGDSPHQSSGHLCAGQDKGSLLVATAARIRAVFPSFRTDPASAATRTLHISAAVASAAHTVQPCHSLPGTQGGQHTALCSEKKGSNPMQSLCTAQGCSELALLDPIWGKIVLSSHDLPDARTETHPRTHLSQ